MSTGFIPAASRSRSFVTLALVCAANCLLMTVLGCGASAPLTPSETGKLALAGHVIGGQQPVSNATLQLYAVGNGGDGSAATPLLSPAAVSLADGSFNITNTYKCPTPSTLVYLVATNGNPGLSSNTVNSSLAMLSPLGACGLLSSATNVVINEVTTVSTIGPLAPFMSGYAALGSGTSDASQLLGAFNVVGELANVSNGSIPGPALPTGYYGSSVEINTLGDILAACVNSSGGVAGDGTPCGTLFKLTTPTGGTAPTDTIGAALQILKNPTGISPSLFSLIPANAPFQPVLAAAPADWTLKIIPMVATPKISPASGTYASAQTVTLSDSLVSASILYSVDGSAPSHPYTGPIALSTGATVQALATASGFSNSNTATATFVLDPTTTSAPVLSPAPGTFATPATVSIASASASAQIFYTLDGSMPTSASFMYSAPLTINSTETLTAVALAPGLKLSSAAGGSYTISAAGSGIITTLAGNGSSLSYNDFGIGGAAFSAGIFGSPSVVAADQLGNIYIGGGYVFKIDPNGVLTYYIGTNYSGFTPAVIHNFANGGPNNMIIDSANNLYLTDSVNHIVLQVTPAGVVTTFAGSGAAGNTGDGGLATAANISYPFGLAFDAAGNLYIGDNTSCVIRKVSIADKTISTVAGNATCGFSGDGGPALSASLEALQGIAVDPSGNLYLTSANYYDLANSMRVRKVTPTGIISTVAGTGTQAYNGDGGPGVDAALSYPTFLAADKGGNLYISDANYGHIRMLTPDGTILTVAGNGSSTVDYVSPTLTSLNLGVSGGGGLAFDPAGNLLIAEAGSSRLRKITFNQTQPQAQPPLFSLATGSYVGTQSTAITSATAGATIYYTLDGSIPTILSSKYISAISVSTNETIYAIAVKTGYSNSLLASGAFTIKSGVPVISPAPPVSGASLTTPIAITLTSPTAGSTIHYSLYFGGSYQLQGDTVYSGPFEIGYPYSNYSVVAYSRKTGLADSDSASATYNFNVPPIVNPVFSPSGGTFTGSQKVTITSTAGATIYYTTDGTYPTSTSPNGLSPVTVTITKSSTLTAYSVEANKGSSLGESVGFIIH